MTNPAETTATTQPQTAQVSDKELNFRKLEERYERMLQEERQKRAEAEAAIQQQQQKRHVSPDEDEEDDSEPYVDRRRLKKELKSFASSSKQETQSEIQKAVAVALEKERQQSWMDHNPDFYDVMQHAESLAQKAPNMAKTILNMPDGFERQKLVYNAIKELGINKKEEPKTSIQDEIKNNKKGNYYTPSGQGTAPYQGYVVGNKDWSPSEGANAYKQMQALKNKLRLG